MFGTYACEKAALSPIKGEKMRTNSRIEEPLNSVVFNSNRSSIVILKSPYSAARSTVCPLMNVAVISRSVINAWTLLLIYLWCRSFAGVNDHRAVSY
ncbi:hypothetical protein AVEN_41945-1 [Araneus ventricosus]|uniref:Uncharacterized protein n=1 Tax=Araneus ventricosus TaxID=182803 RepID=A0A4Y2TDY0_ARAVE|nr:hypothetical protein AVEN_41945-1 [Araneus ventricosus]